MKREDRVWLNIMMHTLILGLYFTDVTLDRACLVYALMMSLEINIGAVLKSSVRKV